MIILDTTTKSLQIKLSASVATNQLPFSASYVDTTGSSTTPGEQDGTSNNTTAVTVVSAPGSSTQRLVKSITIRNADMAAATVTIIYNNNSTLRNILVATLSVGDQLVYEDGAGWSCLDSNGNIKTSGSGGGSPGGSNGQVQYNNAGAFGGLENGQLPGTDTNDNASAGNIGEYVESTVSPGSAVSLTNNTAADITSISLTAGDWDVWGNIGFTYSSAFTGIDSWINTSSATFPGRPNDGGINTFNGTMPSNSSGCFTAGQKRLSLSTTTTVYLSTQMVFTGTASAYGAICARRRR